MAQATTAGWQDRIVDLLSELRGTAWSSEADVDDRLIRPCLRVLGWNVYGANTEVWIPLAKEMAAFWSYPSGRMRRDYVLSSETRQVLHIEAKHRWGTTTWEIEALLGQINRDDWRGTEGDGWKKDLALLSWGAQRQGSHRAALMAQNRLLVFDWEQRWRLVAEARLFEDPPDRLFEAFRLLELAAFAAGA